MIHLTQKNFEKEVLHSDKPVIIDFWAEWCGPCKMIAPIYEELSKEMPELKFTKVDTEEVPHIAADFGVQGIPTLSIVHKGKEVDRIVGFAPKPVLKAKINDILAKIK